MTEYELNDAIQVIASNLIASEALFLTFLSAYAVVAYTVGKKLTSYQISFVNFVFIAFMITSIGGLYSMVVMTYHYGDQLIASHGEVVNRSLGEVTKWAMLITRIVMALGALGFMWQVRHSEVEGPI